MYFVYGMRKKLPEESALNSKSVIGMADVCLLPDDPLVIKLNKIADMYMNEDFGETG